MRTVDEKVPSLQTATNTVWGALVYTADDVGFDEDNVVTFELRGQRFTATVAAAPPAAQPHAASVAPWGPR